MTSFEVSTTNQCCNVYVVVFLFPHLRSVTGTQLHIGGSNTHTHTHTLRTTTAMHPCPNTLTPTFLRLSLGFLHQTAHQVYFLHCGISPLLLSHKSSALPLKGKMTTSSHYNPTRSPFLFHPLCMPPISLHFLHYPSNKTLFYALLFASFRFPALSSSLLQLSFTSL